MKLPKKVYAQAQRLGVEFAHKYTADFPKIEEATTLEERNIRRARYVKAWGAALDGFKAGYRAGLRSNPHHTCTADREGK